MLAKRVFCSKQEVVMNLKEAFSNHTRFSLSLAKRLFPTAINSNMVFSPLAIHVVLGLIAVGSTGTTRDRLLSFLESKSVDEIKFLSSEIVDFFFANACPGTGGPLLSVANSVWVHHTMHVKPSFRQIADNLFNADVVSADFENKASEVANQVNHWCEKESSGLIKELLPASACVSTSRLIFANSFYFKGDSDEEFNASMTKDSEFHLLNGTSVRVPFMTSKIPRYIRTFEGFKVLELPYRMGGDGTCFSIYIFLPNARDGLHDLVEKVSSKFQSVEDYLATRKTRVGKFRLPKFKISYGVEVSKVLGELGFELPYLCRDFTEMFDDSCRDVYVSKFFQKSVIELDEGRTEATSSSVSVRTKASSIPTKVDFVADHPFLFLISEDTSGAVLFVGKVLNPL